MSESGGYCSIVLYGIFEISIELSSLSTMNATWWQQCWVCPTAALQADCRTTHMAATFQVTAPEPFNLSHPEEWEKGVHCFERFKKASRLEERKHK